MRFIFPGLLVLSFLEQVRNIYVSDFGAFAPSTVFVRALQIPRNFIQPFFPTDPLSGRRPSLCMQMTLLSCMSAAWLVRSQLSSDKPVSNQDVRSLFRKSDAVLPLLGQSQRNKGH